MCFWDVFVVKLQLPWSANEVVGSEDVCGQPVALVKGHVGICT